MSESVRAAGTIVAFGHERARAAELAELDAALGAALARGAAAASWRAGLKAVLPWGTTVLLCLAGLGQVAGGTPGTGAVPVPAAHRCSGLRAGA